MRVMTATAVAVCGLALTLAAAPARAAFPGTNGQIVVSGSGEWEEPNLWLSGSDGSPWTQLTDGDWQDSGPAFSPDGSWIAFSSDRGGDFETN
jgi:hypothetical protein